MNNFCTTRRYDENVDAVLNICLQATISHVFKSVGISLDNVPIAMQALSKHSQNNLLYDPNAVVAIPDNLLKECDEILDWANIPLNTKTPIEECMEKITV